MRVTFIVIGPNGRHAIINGVEARVGDVVNGFRVLAIEHGRVKLYRNGEERYADVLPSLKSDPKK